MKKLFLAIILSLFTGLLFSSPKGRSYVLKSPDGRIVTEVRVAGGISFRVVLGSGSAGDAGVSDGRLIVASLPVSMVLGNGEVLGNNPTVLWAKFFDKKETIICPFYKFGSILSDYNMLDIRFKGDFGVIFAACNEGVAYRFYTMRDGEIVIRNENLGFRFDSDYNAFLPYMRSSKYNPFQASFQSTYEVLPLSKADTSKFSFLPLTVDLTGGVKLTLAESDLESYPGMFLKASGTTLLPLFAPYPAQTLDHEKRLQEMVVKSENFIARVNGSRCFPWRIMAISTSDVQIPVNNMVYELGGKSRIADPSWIKPGKVAWDWWNDWGISRVDFKVGINTLTYKYFIDFASANKIEYVVLDEGWSLPSKGDIMSHIPEVDLKELVDYASENNVGLILWTVAKVLDNKLEEACSYYSQMGIKGFKVDFFDRDDQLSVERVYRIAQKCADYKLVLDLHGMYKPTGLNRTFPNILNFEGVFGLEELKWNSTADMVKYDVTFPFIRMFAGPVDYTQGAMSNAVKADFRAVYSNPMSQGTRAHQLGTYIVFDSPLVTLCDSPTAYMKEKDCTDYITSIPTVFDFTKILQGEIGEFIVTLRRSDSLAVGHWYVGGLNNWTSRKVTIDFSFLGDSDKRYVADIIRDGINSSKEGCDYIRVLHSITGQSKLDIEMAPGGGFAISVRPLILPCK